MDLSYTREEEAFRARVREWIAKNKPSGQPGTEDLRAWQRRLHQAGFLGAAWPKEHGGAGLSPMEQAILNEEMARANAPAPLGSMGISWVGPAILRFGTEEQKRKFVPRLLAGDDIWATGYSEPGAGSDMYNTQTRAVRDGDDYVINGQKIWTSLAHLSNWYFLLVRTSSEGHKVAGLTLLLVPMQTPGIEIRRTRMITGDSESMLAEAASLGRPVAIFRLPVRLSFRVLSAFREWVWRRATAKPLGPRGTPRPQRGLERWCGKAIERGYVRPSRDLDRLHEVLFACGAARPFAHGLPLSGGSPAPDDRARVAAAVRELMGVA